MDTSSSPTSSLILLDLHIPKTGGTTLKKLLERQLFAQALPRTTVENEIKNHYCQGVFYYPRGIEEGHRRGAIDSPVDADLPLDIVTILQDRDLRAVIGHFSFGIHSHIAAPSRYITFLRHPIERLLSLYFHILKWPRTEPQVRIAREGTSLEDFVTLSGYKQADNGQTRRVAGMEPDFGECSEELLKRAKSNLSEHFATVGLTERFDESLVLLRRAFGWPLELRYWKRLVNKERPKPDSVGPRTLEVRRERNWLDLQLYEYACELFEQQIAKAGAGFQEEAERVRLQNIGQAG